MYELGGLRQPTAAEMENRRLPLEMIELSWHCAPGFHECGHGVMLHLQTGRVQAAIRRLIKKERATVDANGRVKAHRTRHYGMADLMRGAEDIGGGWSRATVTLKAGDTVWHPYSTKKHFTGVGVWVFTFHPSSAQLKSAPDTRREVYLPTTR